MRRAITALAAGAALALPAAALAKPTVKFKAEAVPIPGFAHTGNILGAGAAVQAEYTIEGKEYAGGPPPLIGVNFYLPKGTTLYTKGFPSCAAEVIEKTGPSACSKGSHAGPTGSALGEVSFGSERVEEHTTIESFYKPGGGLLFFVDGHTPTTLEILSQGHYVHLGGAGGYGPELITEIPEVSTVPGAPFASTKKIFVKAGSAYKSHGKTIYYGRVPKSCPRHGFPIKTELIFAHEGNKSEPETVTATYKAPCPRK